MTTLPESNMTPGHLFCFGLGYTAQRLGRRLLGAGWQVSGTTRTTDALDGLRAVGFTAHLFDGEAQMARPAEALSGVTHIIASIPPTEPGDMALHHHRDTLKSCETLRWMAYLSTPAVYGDRDGAHVSEEDAPTPGSPRGERRLAAEQAWVSAFDNSSVSAQVFRLAGIYGPGRNAIEQVQSGTARIIDKPGQVFNRIHVDDIGSILMASMARPNHGRVYNVADDLACPSGEVIRHACALIGAEPPAPIPYGSSELSAMAKSFYAECKRLRNDRIKDELGVRLTYPTYHEGLAAILVGGT